MRFVRSKSSQDPEKQDTAGLQHDAEHAKPGKRNPVLLYLMVLFAAAFLLLLMSYLMQQRANSETISGLQKTSSSAVESLDLLIEERDALKIQVEDLERERQALEDALAQSEKDLEKAVKENDVQQQQLIAMDYFRRIQAFYTAGAFHSARIVIESFQAAGLDQLLPTDAYYQNKDSSVLSPAEEYQKILDALA